ncbi:hypothetical protein [Bradyrhizobium sp. CCBAU 53421]|uniref:hypothetical protein n=1 Tax=Bradyrhizobium sp. CCBAU 53421 TaxID=1325120 RepID=UPI00188D91F3|nr:hypothetical protein [Bradyrhizobium sp. CCBAU 53421]
MKTAWIYVDTNKMVGDKDHLKVFETIEAAQAWLKVNDTEGAAFEYPVLGHVRSASRTKSSLGRRETVIALAMAAIVILAAILLIAA